MPTPDETSVPATRGAALSAALAAVDALAALGETVEDEWSYVTALAEAGRARLRTAAGDSSAALRTDRAAAVAAACAESGRIADPHRAIDWLSTLPAVVELALGSGGPDGGTPGRDAGGGPRT